MIREIQFNDLGQFKAAVRSANMAPVSNSFRRPLLPLQALHPSFEFLNDNNVAQGITQFVKQHDVEMVAMIAQEHTVFSECLFKVKAITLTFPLTILPGKVIIRLQ